MSMVITLNDSDLREMPSELRDKLWKWYYTDRSGSSPGEASSHTPDLIATTRLIPIVSRREETGRISFPEFVRMGLLAPGTEVFCKALKRQKRSGGEAYVDAGRVLEDGYVLYRDLRYDVPSKLAVDVVNANGGKTPALNGYDYIFVRHSKKLVSLRELRDRSLKRSA